jgi:serine/threonine protein kinase
MTIQPLPSDRPEAPLFCDGLGERVVAADGATGELLQILRVRPALTAVPSFEFALRERTARLANFRHAYYARVRRIDRVQIPAAGLAIVSDHVEGTRLSEILRVAHERRLQLDINTAICLIRQLVPAVALLHENAREVAHGLIAPERVIVTPHARLVIVEHVLGAAIEQLQFNRDRLWQEFRIAMPPSAGLPRFDHRADVTALGLVALALVLGRPLRADEFPNQLSTLLHEARERTALGDEHPLSTPLRDWLARALQLDPRRGFASAPEALAALEDLISDDSSYVAAPVAFETFLSKYVAAVLEPTAPDLAPHTPTLVIPTSHATTAPTIVALPPAPKPALSSVAAPLDSEVAHPVIETDAHAIEHAALPPFLRSTSEPVQSSAPAPRPFAPAEITDEPAEAATPSDPVEKVRAALDVQVTPEKSESAHEPADQPPPSNVPTITQLISAEDLGIGTEQARKRPLFDDEAMLEAGASLRQTAGDRSIARKPIAILVGLGILLGGGFLGWRQLRTAPSAAGAMGTLDVQSNPPGVQIIIDGVDRGMTPARLSVKAGSHILELRGRGVPRVIPFTVSAGSQVSQYLEFADTPATGQLQVQSQPSGAKVLVDGVDRGVAPLTVTDLTPGDHEVVLQSGSGAVKQIVTLQAGGSASLVVPMGAEAAGGPVSGWVSVKAPVSVEIREQGKLLGTSDADRVMMAAGHHELDIVNETVGYRATKVVQVSPGKVVAIKIDMPDGVVNLNASPWAEVWIDGQRVGETPIGNLKVAIGPHEVVFRNPQLGEKRHAISVTLGAPVRLSVDMK